MNDQVYYYKAWLSFEGGDRTHPFPPGHRVIKVLNHPDDDLFARDIRVLVEAPAVPVCAPFPGNDVEKRRWSAPPEEWGRPGSGRDLGHGWRP